MKRTTLAAIALLAALGAQAQPAPRMLTLEDALTITLGNNPAMEAAAYEERRADQERKAAIGLRMPQIGITGAYAYMGRDIALDLNHLKAPVQELAGQILQSGLIPPASIPSISQILGGVMAPDWGFTLQERSLGFIGGDVTMPLFLGGKINAANRAARINARTAVEQTAQQRNALVSEVVERYYGVALARQVVAVRRQVAEGIRRHLQDAIALEEQGMIAHSERLYVEFKMAEAERELQNAELDLETITSALCSTLNREEADFEPVTTMFLLPRIEELAYYRQVAADRNPLLRQVALKRDLAQQGVRAERSAFMPQVVAMGGASFYDYHVTDALPRWAVGVGVNFKLFDGLNREFKYSAAKQTVRRVEALQTQAESNIGVLVEKLYNQLGNCRNQFLSIERSLAFAEEYLASKNAAFLEGMSSSSDLIDAELNLAKVRTERLQAVYQYDVALARLLEAVGLSDEFVAYMRRAEAQPITFD